MNYRSIFEIIGPVMIGPSSSHTAGAVRIGQLARQIFGRQPETVEIHFYGSFAKTYRGHATDVAVVGGLLALATDDVRIRQSLDLAAHQGMGVRFVIEDEVPEHPNTLMLHLTGGGEHLSVTGISIGGGAVQITRLNEFPLQLTGENPALIILHRDVYGVVAAVTQVLSQQHINISHMVLSRTERGQNALMVIETDQSVPGDAVRAISACESVLKTIILD